jgi:hypothetical protein
VEISENLKQIFRDIVYQMPRAKRQAVGEKIKAMQQALGMAAEDLLADRRATNWHPGGGAYATVKGRHEFLVHYRESDTACLLTAEEALQLVKLELTPLRRRVLGGRHYAILLEDGDIATIWKASPSVLAKFATKLPKL